MKTSVLTKAAFVGIGILATAVVACSSGASSSDAGSETDFTDERVAKSLGTNFVRQIKIFSPDPRPRGGQIGTGDYDYLIDVSCGDGGDVAKGAKVSNAFEITWQPGSESQR